MSRLEIIESQGRMAARVEQLRAAIAESSSPDRDEWAARLAEIEACRREWSALGDRLKAERW